MLHTIFSAFYITLFEFSERETRELLAFECCRNSLVNNEKQLTCMGEVDVDIVKKFIL